MFKAPLIHAILGLVSVVPVVLLVASLRRIDFNVAAKQVRKFLENWSGWAPPELAIVVQFSGGFIFLYLLALILSGTATLTLPHVPHKSSPVTDWKLNHGNEWREFESLHKRTYLTSNRETTYSELEKRKNELGRSEVYGSRTAVLLSSILAIAGLADLLARRWRRGGASLILGSILAVIFYALWIRTEAAYVRNMKDDIDLLQTGEQASLPQKLINALGDH